MGRCVSLSSVALVVCLLLTLWGSHGAMREMLESEPRDLIAVAARLREVAGPGERLMARTAHVGAMAGVEAEWFPDVPDIAAMGRWLAVTRSSYLLYGPSERARRPRLIALAEPAGAPEWLEPIFVAPSGEAALYRVRGDRLPEPIPGETYAALE